MVDWGDLRPFDRLTLPPERVRLLAQLKKGREDDYAVASALLNYLEQQEKMPPMDALYAAERLAETAADEFDGEFGKWARDVYYSLDAVRAEEAPDATFYYSKGGPQGDAEYPHTLAKYTDDTEGDFVAEWTSTDAWRGYVEVKPAEGSKWVEVHGDVSLAYSYDFEELREFDAFLRTFMDARGIEYVRAVETTSNLFSAGYKLFVDKEHATKVEALIKFLKPIYRDLKRFTFTALTGKDPDDGDERDRAFATIASAILRQVPDEKVEEVVRAEMEKLGAAPEVTERIIELLTGEV